MLVLCDIYELMDYWTPLSACSVVQGKLRFEWPSLMLFGNARCRVLTPEWIDDETSSPQSLKWADPLASLPPEYNQCVGYDEPKADARIVHFTQGVPCFEETRDSEFAEAWREELNICRSTVSWSEIMGNSVHAQRVLERLKKNA